MSFLILKWIDYSKWLLSTFAAFSNLTWQLLLLSGGVYFLILKSGFDHVSWFGQECNRRDARWFLSLGLGMSHTIPLILLDSYFNQESKQAACYGVTVLGGTFLSEAIPDQLVHSWPASWPQMHDQAQPTSAEPRPDQKNHPSDHRTMRNSTLLF